MPEKSLNEMSGEELLDAAKAKFRSEADALKESVTKAREAEHSERLRAELAERQRDEEHEAHATQDREHIDNTNLGKMNWKQERTAKRWGYAVAAASWLGWAVDRLVT